FVQIARGMALELGLPMDWQIVEERDDQRLRTEALQALLAEEDLAELVNVLRLLSKGEVPRSVGAVLDAVTTALYTLAQLTDAQAWHALPRPSPLSQAAVEDVLQQLATLNFSDARFTKARNGDIAAARREDWATLVSQGLAGGPFLRGNKVYNE